MEQIIFYVLSGVMVASAISAVSSRKMLRSVVYLLFTLIGISGIYFLIDYNFLAAIQLTVYAGGVVVLIIFSVLLVQHIEMKMEEVKRSRKLFTAFLCLMGLSVFLGTIYSHPFQQIENNISTTTTEIGSALLSFEKGGFILPFELISILLLTVMIGAIVIAKGGKEIEPEPTVNVDLKKIIEEAELPEKEEVQDELTV